MHTYTLNALRGSNTKYHLTDCPSAVTCNVHILQQWIRCLPTALQVEDRTQQAKSFTSTLIGQTSMLSNQMFVYMDNVMYNQQLHGR